MHSLVSSSLPEHNHHEPQATAPKMASRKLLVCSIGNPGSAYRNTRHSAGHSILELLRESLQFPTFSAERGYNGGLLSRSSYDDTYTLFQSGSLMNVSGKPVKTAWQAFQRELPSQEERERALLVVLHDELEKPLGQVKLKKTGSPAGHNGLISIIAQLHTKDFLRLGIGIGRPVSHESDVVAKYVLGKFTPRERDVLESQSLEKILQQLKQISEMP
ncbi:peptidyl-tRNA hydrolase [Sphaerosporella brunnea]|uniref:Peptidyl-tRNA hydrolase n=1 Tax=Sphaerosporella brunnea TaxID=1250544 RepID=A0A5J5F4Z0_9PEZI|nr:peptidyl-tRNA hydrolase [Sphaerosporella brunnea]